MAETIPTEPAADAAPGISPDASEQALQGLIDNSRIQIEGLMLAKDGVLPAEQIERVVVAFHQYLETHKADGLSLKQAAKECQYSPATISEWAARHYKGDVSAVTRRVNDFMERDARRRAAKTPSDFITTTVAQSMGAMIQLADKLCSMAALVAPSGAGKTRVLRHFCDQYSGLMVACVPGMVAKHLYKKIADELGWRREAGTRMELLNFIIGKLTGTNRMILLDESHLLGKQIGCVRCIHDLAGVPIIMAGAAEILEAIDGDRANGRGQMASRTLRFNCLTDKAPGSGSPGRRAPTSSAGALLYTREDIARFFAMKNMRLTRDALDMFWALANVPGHGALRLVIRVASTILNANPEIKAICRANILAVLPLVTGEVAPMILTECEERMKPALDAGLAKVG